MVCLRESLPEVREQIQNLADKLGVDYGTAKIILLENNGYDLDKAPSGAESKLYLTLLEHYNGDERKALIAKAKTYLQPFFDWFGNWTDTNSYIRNPYSETISISDVTPDYDSADANGPGAVFVIYNNNKSIGLIAINANYIGKGEFKPWGEDSEKYVSMSSIGDSVEIDQEQRGKGFGKAAYFAFAQKIAKTGKILRSAPANSRTADSTRVWKSLERDGYVKKVGDGYEFINELLTDSVSKVVDENGEPLVVWHGTVEQFDEFDPSRAYDIHEGYQGFHFGSKRSAISRLRVKQRDLFYEDGYLYPVFLNIKNISRIIDPELFLNTTFPSQFLKNLEKDGFVYENVIEDYTHSDEDGTPHGNDSFVVLDPKQIKSIDNQGTFSNTDNNIMKSPSKDLKSSDPTLGKRLFNDKNSTSIGTMLTRLKKDNPNHSAVIDLLLKGLSVKTKSWKIIYTDFASDKNIKDKVKKEEDAAIFDPATNTIYVNKDASFSASTGKGDLTILHEIIHAATYWALREDPILNKELLNILLNIRYQLHKKYGKNWKVLQQENPTMWYGLTDENELLSEVLSNGSFARELAHLPSKDKGLKTAIREFLDWIASIFNKNLNDTALNEVLLQLEDIVLNNLRYNAIQNGPDNIDLPFPTEVLSSKQMKKPTVNELVEKYNQLSDDIEFIKELDGKEVHIYRNRKTGQIYKSVSDVKTDVGYGEQEDKLPEHAVALGDFAKVKGTLLHEALADLITGKFNAADYKQLPSKVISQLRSIAKNITDKYTIIASEQVLADDESGIAGTADLIVQDKKTKKIIILDFKTKIKNLGEQKKSGFAYYHSSKFGKPDAEKHNFQLSMYEKMHNLYGFEIDERGIVPIEYDTDNDGNILSVYITPQSKGTTLENKGYYTIPHRSQIDQDIDLYAFGGNIDLLMDQIQLDRQSEIVGKILDTLKNKVVSLYSKGRSTQATDIENTVNEFNSLSEQEIIIEYIKTALDNLRNIIDGKKGYNEHLQRERTEGNTVWNLKQLENWRDVARSFEPLQEVQQYLFDYQDTFSEDVFNEIMPILDEAVRYRDILQGAYKTKGKALWIEWIKPFIKNIEGAYRLKAEREYKRTHKEKEINKQEMNAYIEKYIQDNKTKIEIETKNFINKQSMEADEDVNGFYRWVDTIFQTKDPVISGMALAYDTMIQQTNETFNIKYKKLVDLTREMENRFGSNIMSDPKKVYDYMLEEGEDGIRLISEISEDFTIAYRKAVKNIEQDEQYKTNFERFKAKMQWLDKNAPISDKNALKQAKIHAVEQYLDSLDVTLEEYDAIIDNEYKKGRNRKSYYELAKEGTISYKRADDLREISEQTTWKFRKPNATLYPNKKWDELLKLRKSDPNDIRVRFFDFIKLLADEGDSNVAPRYKLNGRIPGMSKTSVERLAAGQNLWTVIKEETSKDFKLKADDTMYGQFEMTDELNHPVNFIPVFFTNRLKNSDQSYDIPTIYKEWFKSALTYANTNEIIDQLEFTRFIVNERRTKTGGMSFASKVWKRLNPDSQIAEQWATKDSSNLANQLNDWFDLVVYGKSTDPMGTIAGVDMGKVVSMFTKYTSLRVMGLNYISMVNNMAMAEVAQAIETFAHQYVSPSTYTKATAEYSLALLNGDIVGDVGARKPTSKINLLNELFGTFSDYDNGRMRLSNKFSRLFNSGAFYFTTNIGEHEAQSRFLIASLMEERALDSNGNDIGSIYDFYTVEDGELVFDKEGKVSNWDDNKRRQTSARIRSQLMSMHGNYSAEWKVALQRNGYLKLALMFRKWIVPSWRKRWDCMYYDNVTQSYKEGYYRTGLTYSYNKVKKFFYKLTDESKAAEIAINADWHNLTEMEKQNVRRFATEVTITLALLVLYNILKGYADDEDDKFIDNLAYQAYRLRLDMGFYYDFTATMKIVQSPFPSTSSVRSFANLFESIFDPTAKYERGPWKGHYKVEKRVYDMLPVVRQLYRARDIENEYNILNMK